MIEIALMIEGQNGLNWSNWQRIAKEVEKLGMVGLYRSDHFTNANPPDKDSLELWTSLTWLASHTERIEFGCLVTPVSFRHPTLTARMAAAVDDLSGGRLTLGVGAGWQEREHKNFGLDLLDVSERFQRFQEGIEVISRLLRSPHPVNYEGKYYHLNDAILLPRPQRIGGPPILIGGNGIKRTLPLAARYADEWNGVFLTVEEFKIRNSKLDDLLIGVSRKPEDVKRSMMTGCVFARTRDEVEKKVAARTGGQRSSLDLRQRGLIVGTADEVTDQILQLEQAGVQRVMLQWLDLDDLSGLQAMSESILL